MIKKAITAALTLLITNYAFADTGSKSNNINISPDLKLISKTHKEENKNLHLTADFKYPALSGKLNTNAQDFNKKIDGILKNQMSDFKKQVTENLPDTANLPKEMNINGIYIDYTANVIKPTDHPIISVRFDISPSYAGTAHPAHLLKVVNYDLNTGKDYSLNDLFSGNYLEVISNYSSKELKKQLQDSDEKWLSEGSAAKPENYSNWNIKSNGILITFAAYQVAAYAVGQPEVLIPYSELKSVIPATSPIAPCVEDTNACKELK